MNDIPILAKRLCVAVDQLTKHRTPPSWTGINPVLKIIRCTDLIECDRAVLHTLQQNWINVNPTLPIHSLALTRYGVYLVLSE